MTATTTSTTPYLIAITASFPAYLVHLVKAMKRAIVLLSVPTPGHQDLPLRVVIFLDWVKVEWTTSLDRQALVLFRNELNYK